MISFIKTKESLGAELSRLLAQYQIEILDEPSGNESFLIYADNDENLEVLFRDGKTRISFKGYFSSEIKLKKKAISEKSLLRKALGKNKFPVLDLTGGFLKDSIEMLCIGHDVIALEKSSIPFFLLSKALDAESEQIGRLLTNRQFEFHNEDAADFLEKNELPSDRIIYLDPFFPDLKKNRLKKKEMIFLKAFGDEKFDEARFLDYCLGTNVSRIVVKRQTKSPYMGLRKPSYSLSGTTIRYDIYI